MKVLQINAVYGRKSTGKIVEEIKLVLENEGHEAYVAGPFELNKNIHGYKVGNTIDWKLHALLTRVTGKQSFYSRFATKQFLKYLGAVKPDIIHLHNIHANFLNLPLLIEYMRNQGIGLVITLHDSWYFTGKCFHFADIGCGKYQIDCKTCPKKMLEVPTFFKDNAWWCYRQKKELFASIANKKIIGCSQWIASLAKQSFFNEEDVDYIYNGINTEVFRLQDKISIRRNKGFENEFVILGMANKWELRENETTIKNLFQHYSQSNTIFLIVGCRLEAKKRFEELADGYDVKLRLVEYIQSSDELAEYYSSADVFVNLTHVDTLPTVNMESICCGTPVVTYNSGGSPELILPGCGFTVNKDECSALIEAIEDSRALDSANIAEEGKKAFSAQLNFKKYLEVYSSLMND